MWLADYLTNRFQSVMVNSVTSTKQEIHFGVPQGSVLGPILFNVYLTGIDLIFRKHEVEYILYADVIQMWVHTSIPNFYQAANKIKACVNDVTLWLRSQALYVNTSKTEIMVLGSRQLVSKVPCVDLDINGMSTVLSTKLRDLGVILDNSLVFDAHISKVCSSAFVSLRTISRVRRSLSNRHCSLLINSLVLSRILFCATIYFGIANHQIRRLERILQAARRLLHHSTSDTVSSNSGLINLSMDSIIKLRVAVLTFDVLNTALERIT
jgi:hypothetical protein